jgi:hypothetical protein
MQGPCSTAGSAEAVYIRHRHIDLVMAARKDDQESPLQSYMLHMIRISSSMMHSTLQTTNDASCKGGPNQERIQATADGAHRGCPTQNTCVTKIKRDVQNTYGLQDH